jgi:hypothetical protein
MAVLSHGKHSGMKALAVLFCGQDSDLLVWQASVRKSHYREHTLVPSLQMVPPHKVKCTPALMARE